MLGVVDDTSHRGRIAGRAGHIPAFSGDALWSWTRRSPGWSRQHSRIHHS
jgi:hypothetical protein